jgi:colanic acid/amylovoran biosynthesis glycosyltransferase
MHLAEDPEKRRLHNVNSKVLSVLPGIRGLVDERGFVLLTQKFIAGIETMRFFWGGAVQVFLEPSSDPALNLDDVWIDPASVGFEIFIVDYKALQSSASFMRSAVVLGALGYRQNSLSRICNSLRIPCVYVAELTLKTRLQIVATTTPNLIVKWRRALWEINQERKNKDAIRFASGVQCNGTPTFEAYQHIARSAMLFFDTRLSKRDLATEEDLQKRISRLEEGRPLQLVFSGRLVSIKGLDYLLDVALRLMTDGLDFQLSICGDGPMRPFLEKFVIQNGLNRQVKFLGVLDFSVQLLPFLKSTADVFVCCHTQGDPSCTYLETLGCGIPIVGYGNEALAGISKLTDAVFVSAENDPIALASTLQALDKDRRKLIKATLSAMDFSRQRVFENEFQQRIEHLKHIGLQE